MDKSASMGPLGWSTKCQGTWEESVHCVWVIGIGSGSLLCGPCSGPSTSFSPSWLRSGSLEGTVSDRHPWISLCGSPGFQQKVPMHHWSKTNRSLCTLEWVRRPVWLYPCTSPSMEQLSTQGTSLGWWVQSLWVSAMLPQLQGHCQRGPPPSHPILSPEMWAAPHMGRKRPGEQQSGSMGH